MPRVVPAVMRAFDILELFLDTPQLSAREVTERLDLPRTTALRTGLKYCQLGNPSGIPQVDRAAVMGTAKKFEVI